MCSVGCHASVLEIQSSVVNVQFSLQTLHLSVKLGNLDKRTAVLYGFLSDSLNNWSSPIVLQASRFSRHLGLG